MPRLTRLMVRAALVWLLLGYAAGALALLHKGLGGLPWAWGLRLGHAHMLLVGWTVQLACGVAFWILPRLDAAGSRGDERLAWLCAASLNLGVLLAASGAALGVASLTATGATLYVVGAAAFAAHAWRRVVPFRPLPRPGRDAG